MDASDVENRIMAGERISSIAKSYGIPLRVFLDQFSGILSSYFDRIAIDGVGSLAELAKDAYSDPDTKILDKARVIEAAIKSARDHSDRAESRIDNREMMILKKEEARLKNRALEESLKKMEENDFAGANITIKISGDS